ncbi:MAG: DNA-3-methyladenine glycosylase [Thermoplasmata archaeon]|nr:DNA-3-methyladenine glycosylase [Thermoplasmata archaeon]
MPPTLPRSFFAQDADLVARQLLGHLLVHETPEGRASGRIVETEAYFGPPGRNPQLAQRDDMPARLRARLMREGDPASHSFVGTTARNRVMYGPPGHAYVYLIYGMHECLNVTTGPDGEPQAVLLRALDPVEGVEQMARRRKGRPLRELANGPGKLCQALGVTRRLYGADMTRGELRFERGEPAARVEATPRVGVVGAEDLKLRYVAEPSRRAPQP